MEKSETPRTPEVQHESTSNESYSDWKSYNDWTPTRSPSNEKENVLPAILNTFIDMKIHQANQKFITQNEYLLDQKKDLENRIDNLTKTNTVLRYEKDALHASMFMNFSCTHFTRACTYLCIQYALHIALQSTSKLITQQLNDSRLDLSSVTKTSKGSNNGIDSNTQQRIQLIVNGTPDDNAYKSSSGLTPANAQEWCSAINTKEFQRQKHKIPLMEDSVTHTYPTCTTRTQLIGSVAKFMEYDKKGDIYWRRGIWIPPWTDNSSTKPPWTHLTIFYLDGKERNSVAENFPFRNHIFKKYAKPFYGEDIILHYSRH